MKGEPLSEHEGAGKAAADLTDADLGVWERGPDGFAQRRDKAERYSDEVSAERDAAVKRAEEADERTKEAIWEVQAEALDRLFAEGGPGDPAYLGGIRVLVAAFGETGLEAGKAMLAERDERVKAEEREGILADLYERRGAAIAMSEDECRKEKHRHHAAGRVCGYDLAVLAIRDRGGSDEDLR